MCGAGTSQKSRPFGCAQGESLRDSRDGAGATKGKYINLLRGDGVGLFAVDAEVGDGFFHDFFFDFSVEEKLVERGESDEARVHFKEIAEGFAVVAAAEAVGAERRDAARNPRADHVRKSFQVVGGGDEHAGRIFQHFGDVRDARLFGGVQAVPAVRLDSVGVESFVAGDAPDVGGDAVFLLENFLGAKSFVEDCAAAEKLRAQL